MSDDFKRSLLTNGPTAMWVVGLTGILVAIAITWGFIAVLVGFCVLLTIAGIALDLWGL